MDIMTSRDSIYARKIDSVEPFHFGSEVAGVFDDMAARSIPLYNDLQAMAAELAVTFYRTGTKICDFGCSTGNTVKSITEEALRRGMVMPRIIGIDRSADMIEKAKSKCTGHDIRWICGVDEQGVFRDASVVLALYVLQFIDRSKRPGIVKEIYDGLIPGGMFLMAEKLRSADDTIEIENTRLYHNFKRSMGYSDLEIKQKDQALRGILVPMKMDENIAMLERAGFKKWDILLKHLNFTCFVAVK